MLQGTDTSFHQHDIDEGRMKAEGVDFRYLKLSEGGDFVDASSGAVTDSNETKLGRHIDRVRDIRARGMRVGGYHYLRARADRTGAQEMDFALKIERTVGLGREGDLRLAIDIEDPEDLEVLGVARTRAYLVSAIKRYVEKRGHRPVLYSFPFYLKTILEGASSSELATIGACPLWIAHFGVTAPTIPAPFTESAIWQKSSKATVGGESPVDFNVADERRFKRALVPTTAPVPVDPDPDPEPHRDVDVQELQRSLNRFASKWLCDTAPLIVDGVKGPATNRRVMTVKYYLGYGKSRTGKVTSQFVRRMRHPRDPRFSTPALILTGIRRRRQLRKACAAQDEIPGFKGAVLYDGKPVPAWTVQWLDKARNDPVDPWQGRVNSGIRTTKRSIEICHEICGAATCRCCPACAGAGSNHNADPPVEPCEGALDVSDFVRFGQKMRKFGAPLRNAIANDPVHYSCSGR